MRTLRLFSLLDQLRGRREPVSAEVLARELDVSARTIYRDMASLQAMGAPIRGESGIGYQIEKGYFLPPLSFDADELDAIMLGMRLVAAKGDSGLAEAGRRVTGKIGAVLDPDRRERFASLPLLAVTRGSSERRQSEANLGGLRQALRERLFIILRYVDLKEQESLRLCRPLGLVAFDDVWVLTVWCEARQDFRNFRVDRIQSFETSGKRFRPEPGKRFEDYLKSMG
jgi:predicted DNA-binding transcriptional regulator YafY